MGLDKLSGKSRLDSRVAIFGCPWSPVKPFKNFRNVFTGRLIRRRRGDDGLAGRLIKFFGHVLPLFGTTRF